MADIVFITPNGEKDIADESVGTLLLATILRRKGLQAEILQFYRFGDAKDFQNFLNTATEMILREQPKIVSFYTRCDSYHIMLKMAEQLKKQADVHIVFGGPQADISAVDTLREIPYVDYICCGEGENTVYPLFSSLLRDEPDLSVPGLVYRSAEGVVKNPRPELIEDLDTLPDVDYSLLHYEIPPQSAMNIDVGRGCPFGCTYCSTKTFWGRKYRLKSPQRIVSEMKSLHDQFGITHFKFEHDMFTMNRKQVIETCRLIKELDFPATWQCSARMDCIDKELVDIMADSGLRRFYFGIETGSPRMQKLINKNLKLDGVVDMLSYIHSKKIMVTTSFIYGFPEETEEDLSQTIALMGEIAKTRVKNIQTHLCTFLPGTELTRRYQSGLTPMSYLSNITGSLAVEECTDLIAAHPSVFQQFMEYYTDLRVKAEHLGIFIYMWLFMQPVYQYFSEKYPRERLFDMYCDFAEANQEILSQTKELEISERFIRLIDDDRFAKRFEKDEYYDIIADYYRMMAIKRSEKLQKPGNRVVDVFCFSPANIERHARLQDYTRKTSVVTFTSEEDGTVTLEVRGRKSINI